VGTSDSQEARSNAPLSPEWFGLDEEYSEVFGFAGAFPIAMSLMRGVGPAQVPANGVRSGKTSVVPLKLWPIHCYGMVGVGRDMPPDTGSGAELYAVIGHAPRHLDRNIALVGRVIEGIEHLSSLPRGTEALGFYASAEERTAIESVRIGSEVKDLPTYEYLSTESASFAAYAEARANRRDAFFVRPAGGADICNIPVPVRRAK
jgi:peptidylprolyl isomerase